MKIFINPSIDTWPQIIQRPELDSEDMIEIVSSVLRDINLNGDNAVKKYTLKFDKIELQNLLVSEDEIKGSASLISNELKNAIQLAKDNIEKFHQSQIQAERKVETSKGVLCWRKNIAIEKIGLYIPGGTAPLFSTLLMLAIPALLAGCKEIIVCTPAGKDGNINGVILYVASILGLKKIYKVGGAQAIGAMAYGTQTIPKVYKIFGPGNQYVTAAKQKINSEGIAIDMPAGPSEVAIYADETSNASFVAADLLSQAEHGTDSQVLLVTTSQTIIENIQKEITAQLKNLSRRKVIEKSLANSRFIMMENVDRAFELLNEYAPEHLIIASDKAEELSKKVTNAGSVFIGHYSPESAGDYASGTNHTLPTNGYAKAYSGVSIESFVKKITFQTISEEGIRSIGNAVETLAAAEGLDAHKNAITVRLKKLNNSHGI